MKKFLLVILSLSLSIPLYAQNEETTEGPYKLNLKYDLPVTALGIGGTIYGWKMRESKSDIDSLTIVQLEKTKFSGLNAKAVQQVDPTWGKASDFLLASGFLVPFTLLFDQHIRQDAGTVGLLFLETMALTGVGYWGTAGLYDKYRPYAYNPKIAFHKRSSKHAKNSFYGGHPSVTAAGLFFMSQVYSDYYPESSFKYVLWSGATVATLANAYLRYKGGFHFPSDIAVGVAVGTAAGILVPVLHRKKNRSVTILPYKNETTGVIINWTLN